ncbi:MAG: hypothetical protein ACLUN5_11695 [Oscillospiraceae bacterium]
MPEGIFCAASTAHLPLAAESLDLIVNIFRRSWRRSSCGS